ncbi:ImmA/IrrE family metallo-endopeptidase [Cetobacterium sp.]|uniref:ImmA/IrrE family metallo-endopeptidase n=1 Tax=Cetobacterium sp. TaxID=2071632 RepID=UPI003EE59C28
MIEEIVKEIVYEWGSEDPFRLCKCLGIRIKYGDYGTIKGAFSLILNKKCIFLNDSLSDSDKIIVLAHELGHAILHSDESTQELLMFEHMVKPGKLENEANLFAFSLLKEKEFSEETEIDLLNLIENL